MEYEYRVDWRASFKDKWRGLPTVEYLEALTTPQFFEALVIGKYSRWACKKPPKTFYDMLLWVGFGKLEAGFCDDYPGDLSPEEESEHLLWARHLTGCDLHAIVWYVGQVGSRYHFEALALLHSIRLGHPVISSNGFKAPITQYLYLKAVGYRQDEILPLLYHGSLSNFPMRLPQFKHPLPERGAAEPYSYLNNNE